MVMGAVSLIGSASAWYAAGCGFDSHIMQHSLVEFGSEIISMAILSLLLKGSCQLLAKDKV